MWEAPIGQPYLDLKKTVGSKPAFILTTNVDMQVSRLFSKEQVCTFQGDFGFCQCSQPCHDQIWTNYGLVQRLTQALDGVKLPEEMVPRCPDCGRVLIPWVRDDTFWKGPSGRKVSHVTMRSCGIGWPSSPGRNSCCWSWAWARWRRASSSCPSGSWLPKTRMFLRLPESKDSHAPEHLKGKSLYLQGDLAETLSRLRLVSKYFIAHGWAVCSSPKSVHLPAFSISKFLVSLGSFACGFLEYR